MKAIFYLIAALVVGMFSSGVPSAMAGAYNTGYGQGYASSSSTEIMPAGNVIRFVRIQSDVYPKLCIEIDQLRNTVPFKSGLSGRLYIA